MRNVKQVPVSSRARWFCRKDDVPRAHAVGCDRLIEPHIVYEIAGFRVVHCCACGAESRADPRLHKNFAAPPGSGRR